MKRKKTHHAPDAFGTVRQVVEAGKVPAGGGLDRWEGEEGNTESSHERIEELRVFLEKELGFDRFFASYQYVKENKVSLGFEVCCVESEPYHFVNENKVSLWFEVWGVAIRTVSMRE